mgnify:FL=1
MRIIIENKTYRVIFTHNKPHLTRTTLCVIEEDGGQRLFSTGLAECLIQDNFNRAVGRKIALTRAVRQAFPREQRRAFWAVYWSVREQVAKKKWVA